MQVVSAGEHKLIQLELDAQVIAGLAREAGFDCRLEDRKRNLALELRTPNRRTPLLLFDAADPANLGWFSRCTFYVDGHTGSVLQTPISVANICDRSGHALPDRLRIQLSKELPATFHLPGHGAVTENTVYTVLVSFLQALLQTGVGVCGGSIVRPLAGRTQPAENRN